MSHRQERRRGPQGLTVEDLKDIAEQQRKLTSTVQ